MGATRPRLPELWRHLDPETALDSIADGVFLVDERGRIVFWNRGAERITGFSRQEAQGQVCSFLQGRIWQGREPGATGCCALFDLGAIDAQECEIFKKDGSAARIVRSARLLHDANGKVSGGIHNFSDLTGQRRLEARVEEAELERRRGLGPLVGQSHAMQELYALVERLAATNSTVVVQGESGTGKELVARTLHDRSPRAAGPFVAVNVTALPATLLESELFGHVRGAFTGAAGDREGRLELAHGGTLFLDEIGDLPPELQPKLLRVLQERAIERVGESRPRKVDVRVVAATHRDLKEMVRDGRFREDLYYRLAVFTLNVPPLRERKDDLPLLVEHILAGLAGAPRQLDAEALARMLDYCWPGNVRELQNALEHAIVLARGDALTVDDLPPELRRELCENGRAAALSLAGREQTEVVRIREALRRTGGNRTHAAALLGMTRSGLWKKMKRLGVEP